MIKQEWKYLIKHKLLLISFIVMIFIPSIYSVTFLKSMWDPYGELKDLPVAVVNNDKDTNYQGTKLKVGHDLAKSLKKSNAMDFQLVSSKAKAKKGLSDGKYYMTITIPKNFSQNATTLLNKKPQKMVLNYETSAGHNFTASKMTASSAKEAAASVSDQVTKTYAKTMFASIKQVSTGMDNAAKGSQKLANGNQKVFDANKQITQGLNTLSASSLTFSNGTSTLNQGIDQYLQGVNQLASGSNTLDNGLQKLNNKSRTLSSGVDQLTSGGQALNSGLQSYTSGVATLNSSIQTLNSGSSKLSNGTDQLANSSNTLNSGLNQIHSASQELTSNLQKVSSGLNGSNTQLNSSIDSLKNQLANDNSQQATTIKNDLTKLQQAVSNQNNSDLSSKVSQVADEQGLTAAQKAAIMDTVNNSNGENLSQLTQSLSTDLNNLFQTQANVSTQINALTQPLTASQDELSTAISQLANGSQELTTQLGNATSGMSQLNSGISTVNTSSKKLASGTNQLSSGSNQLANNSNTLTAGLNTLTGGIDSMDSQMPSLTSGVNQLANGADTLNSGVSQLNSKGQELSSGSAQLTSGADQIASGAQTLSSGSSQMGSGIDQVTDGSKQLTAKLVDGAKKSDIKATKLTYAQLAKPTTTKQTERDTAPNNGTGMAPYMLSVSLFVGALAFNLIFDSYTPRKFPHTGFSWWLSKNSVTGIFVLGESIAALLLLIAINGLAPVKPFETFAMIFCTGAAFMSIVHWLNLVLGKVGAFLSMILLVLQLGGSAGTYPIQLSNDFFNSIHPYLPMTYSVNGLRQTLMIGDSAKSEILILISITIIFSILSILFFVKRKSHLNEIDFTKESAEHSLV
ncbi:YhgE/Pip domain-containing protein [Companilactobacillus halodurans]|uniref:YhgE/Pip domain-containing protein n=1 Tax=Companilactobacillus halodurans TaxID=2584183 RepID=A0A5P0ZZI3_9LACO|nr:YhgE/Pip domain-containing protein [Companilactobacillus halodurans]MQS98503.1 YhgE/Pip domain-containing protein [Companilactobacillus halodurans]